jgi:hypothetical protein
VARSPRPLRLLRAVAASVEARCHRAPVIGCVARPLRCVSGIKPALRYGPLVALVSVSRLLFIALATLWVGIHVRAAVGGARAGAASCARIGTGVAAITTGRVAVSGINRWRIRYDIAVGPCVVRVIHVVSVVVRNSTPPIGCVHRWEYTQEPRIAPSVIGARPVATSPISAAPVRAMPAKSAMAIAISVAGMTNVRRSAGEATYVSAVCTYVSAVCMDGCDAPASVATAKSC